MPIVVVRDVWPARHVPCRYGDKPQRYWTTAYRGLFLHHPIGPLSSADATRVLRQFKIWISVVMSKLHTPKNASEP